MKSGHLVVTVFGLMAVAGLVATNLKIQRQLRRPTKLEVAQRIIEDKMNPFADTFEREMAAGKKPNRLIHEKSPYLLQHAFNPVDWYAWGEEAFEKARREDKPIFLSIGYSTCHWCHVMEHESFENDSIAALMNENYVCIKVDREERPDVDKVYMSTVQALTGGGGWPLSVWLTPDLKPFYGGTYFPPDSRYGRPGFPDVLRQLSRAWKEQREKVVESGDHIIKTLQLHLAVSPGKDSVDFEPLLRAAYSQFYQSFDVRLAGFGDAPKFPRPSVLSFLTRYYHRTWERNALEMALHTLRRMAAGGMYDHLGGGFHRYSVDAYWRVPHFEKMLYDQAQLVWSYLEAYQITKDQFLSEIAGETLDYVMNDMTHPEGGFYSAEDADSAPDASHPEEKKEGAFYMWRKPEIIAVLGEKEAELFNYVYGVSDTGNTISDPQGEFGDSNVLYEAYSIPEASRRFGRSQDEIFALLMEAKARLLEARSERPRPHLDDKVITAWNGLMVSAFARGYQVLNDSLYLAAAKRAAGFVLEKSYDRATHTLKRRYRDGEAKFPAHLDDYAFFIFGMLDLYEASFENKWLEVAIGLTETQIRLFYDEKDGGFFDTSGEDESILLRAKEDYDGAEPSGNSIAAWNLWRLSHMLDRQDWREKAERTMQLFAARIAPTPHAMPQMLAAIEMSLEKPVQIIIAGDPEVEDTRIMLAAVHQRFIPHKILMLAHGESRDFISRYVPAVGAMNAIDGKATAYVCENYACQLPTTEVEVMMKQLQEKKQ